MSIRQLCLMGGVCCLLVSCTGNIRFGKIPDQVANAVSTDVECRIYLRTGRNELPPLPVLPKDRTLTSEELNIVQANYIVTLRNFISAERVRLDDDYNRYIRECLR